MFFVPHCEGFLLKSYDFLRRVYAIKEKMSIEILVFDSVTLLGCEQ